MRVTRQHFPPGHLGGGLPPPFFIGEVRPERDQAGLLKQTVLVASDGRFLPNLQYRRFWIETENRWIRLRISNAGLRLIDKKGIDVVLADLRARGQA